MVRDSFDDITNADIEKCINRRAVSPDGELDLAIGDTCIKDLHIKMHVPGAENRIDTLVWAYLKALEESGLEDFPEKCPKLAIGHIYDRLKPPLLKQMMDDEFDLQHSIGLRKNDFYKFVSELVKVANAVEKTSRRGADTPRTPSHLRCKRHRDNTGGRGSSLDDDKHKGKEPDRSDGIVNPSKKPKPDCLHPDCDGKHYIRDFSCAKKSRNFNVSISRNGGNSKRNLRHPTRRLESLKQRRFHLAQPYLALSFRSQLRQWYSLTRGQITI